MAQKDVVIRSINEPGGPHCVDVLRGADGRYRWACYRRDPEDPRGWYAAGMAGDAPGFATVDAALADAAGAVPWLAA